MKKNLIYLYLLSCCLFLQVNAQEEKPAENPGSTEMIQGSEGLNEIKNSQNPRKTVEQKAMDAKLNDRQKTQDTQLMQKEAIETGSSQEEELPAETFQGEDGDQTKNVKFDTKESEKNDMNRESPTRQGKDHSKNLQLELGIGIGFTEEDYYLPPPQRVQVIAGIVKDVPTATFFVEEMETLDADCLFPEDGYYTVLIPHNDKFQNLIIDIESEEEKCEIFKRFIVPEIILLDEIEEEETFTTLAGEEIVVSKRNDKFFVNDIEIVRPSIQTQNGILINMIHGVLE